MKKILDETNYMRRLMGLNLLNEQDANESTDSVPLWLQVVEGLGKDKFKVFSNAAVYTNNVDKFKITIGSKIKDVDKFTFIVGYIGKDVEYDNEDKIILPEKFSGLINSFMGVLPDLPDTKDWQTSMGVFEWGDLGPEYKDKVINALKDKI